MTKYLLLLLIPSLSQAATFVADQIIDKGLTASQACVSDSNKQLASLAYGTASSATSLVERDANQNAFANNFTSKGTNVVSAGATTILTAASTRLQNLTGTLAQTFQLPDATTLTIGSVWEFDNNSSGVLSVTDGAGGALGTVPAGGYARFKTTAVSTSAGAWDWHYLIPKNSSWGTAGATVTGTLNTTGTATLANVIDSGLTASTVPYADASKQLTSSAVTPTELGYVSGVTSSIQTQLNAKGAGTVTAVSVASSNGFAGSSSGGATPALTLSTTVTGIAKGNGTALSAATAGTDYSAGTSGLATGILKSTTATGALSIAASGTDYQAPLSTSAAVTNQFVTGFTSPNTFTRVQPAFTDISGTATVAQTTVATQALTTCTTARTVNWSTGNSFTLTLTSGNACTLTFSNPTAGQTITLWLTNGSAGGTATVTWPTAKWFPAGAPVMTTGTGALDVCTCTYNGSDYACNCLQNGG